MGLELVEIVMEVEETFGVIVSDEAAPEIRTVGNSTPTSSTAVTKRNSRDAQLAGCSVTSGKC